ncbi:MAG: MBL fold metallo-hydrolase [Planctomycetota bacterium]|nr:MAG: MBL fold metallo-hydrolase [Planctomycetota bacterium]
MQITIVCDNNAGKDGLETGWGFSCLVSGGEKTILFDTGPGRLLLDNMERLEIEPGSIDVVVLSHIHGDHTGGLDGFLGRNPEVSVYLPVSFPKQVKDGVARYGAEVIEVKEPVKICRDVYSVGQVGRLIKEQALVVRTEAGPVLIVGCAHPGVAKFVNASRKLLNSDIFLVIGGFHLEWAAGGRIRRVISALKESGVRYVGACHCCGDKSRRLFEEQFGEKFINLGAGRMIRPGDLH